MGSRSQPVRAPPGSAAAPGLACIPGRRGFTRCTRRWRAGKRALALPLSAPPAAPRTSRTRGRGGGRGQAGASRTAPARLSSSHPRLFPQTRPKPGENSTVTPDPLRLVTPRTRRSCWRAY